MKLNKDNSNLRKCLVSPIHKEPHKMKSMHLCKNKLEYKIEDENTYYIPFGPRVIVHKDSRKVKGWNTVNKNKSEYEDSRYDYFGKHKDCKESEFYWRDQLHPKILRHISKDKKGF